MTVVACRRPGAAAARARQKPRRRRTGAQGGTGSRRKAEPRCARWA